MRYIRPHFAAKGEDALFVKDDGYQFSPGTIGRRVTDFFSQLGIRTDIRVTATNIRKLFSDKAFELSPSKKRLLNSHMKHRERTADSNYVLVLNAKRASTAHQIMRDIINEQKPSTSADSHAKSKVKGSPKAPKKTPACLQRPVETQLKLANLPKERKPPARLKRPVHIQLKLGNLPKK